jgi:hypothetical protein
MFLSPLCDPNAAPAERLRYGLGDAVAWLESGTGADAKGCPTP